MTRTILVVAGVVGCSDGTSSSDTGSTSPTDSAAPTPHSGTTDTAPPEAEDTITVNAVFSRGPSPSEPRVNAVVSVADASGSHLFSVTTDERGNAELDDVPDGASVTLVVLPSPEDPFQLGATLDTIFDVRGGDTLQFGFPSTRNDVRGGVVTLNIAANPSKAGTPFATVTSRCGGFERISELPSNGVALGLYACPFGSVDLLAVNYETFVQRTAVAFISTTFDFNEESPLDTIVLDGWSNDAGVVNVAAPAGLTGADSFDGRVYGRFGDTSVLLGEFGPEPNPIEAKTTSALDSVVVETSLGDAGRLEIVPSIPATGQATRIELSRADYLPALAIESFEVETARPTVTLSGTSPSARCGDLVVDAVRGDIEVDREALLDDYGFGSWSFISPPGTDFTLPELDPSLGPVWPTGGDLAFTKIDIVAVAVADADYETMRRRNGASQSYYARVSAVTATTCTSRAGTP